MQFTQGLEEVEIFTECSTTLQHGETYSVFRMHTVIQALGRSGCFTCKMDIHIYTLVGQFAMNKIFAGNNIIAANRKYSALVALSFSQWETSILFELCQK